MNQSTSSFFHPSVQESMSQIIAEHGGAEVFFIGWVDRNGTITEFEPIAYGNDESVPAPLADGLKGDVVIHNHPSGDLRASNPDINIASLLATKKLGFYIINNDCSEVNIVYKPKVRVFLQEEQVLSIFQKDGALQELIGSYEERPEQEQLVSKIIDTINNDKIFLAEAGTGTGKSLSYLIPTTIWAVLSDKRVFISTHTITLQSQIAKKDAELVSVLVERVTGIRPRFAVLVGRSNYLCLKGLDDLEHDQEKKESLFDDTSIVDHQIDMVKIWAHQTEEGLRGEIPQQISNDLWEELSASTPNCPRKECPFYTDCFYYKARMTAEASHIIIGNHALLLAAIDDNSGFMTTIPHFSGVVLDEAHNLPQITLNAMAQSFSFGSITWRLSRLYRKRGNKTFGQLSLLHDRTALERHPDLFELFHKATHEILDLNSLIRVKDEEFMQLFANSPTPSLEINKAELMKQEWRMGLKILEEVFDKVRYIDMNITKLLSLAQESFKEERVLEILRVIDIHNQALNEIRQTFKNIFEDLDNEHLAVRQMELGFRQATFSAGPALVGDFLSKHVFRPKDFSILSSATLSVNKSFDFFSKNIGLEYAEPNRVDSISLPSPFDYKNQMKVFVVNENHIAFGQQEKEKWELVREAVFIAGGGTLILFTSYKTMNAAYQFLAKEFEDAGLLPVKQGDHSRDHLLNTIRSKDYAVLFATSSFWEGIDVPGDNLRLVIIDKLPFDSPSNPLNKAIFKIMEENGQNPFSEYSVPRAVLKYKQGIGRLIRSKKDRGVLIVLDGRIFSKSYGRNFVNAALPAESLYSSPKQILEGVYQFFMKNATRRK
ncbi:MAG: helicase C-terminal domain-containing protein [Brevinema sp.]